jgi:flagellar assembly protein FliH
MSMSSSPMPGGPPLPEARPFPYAEVRARAADGALRESIGTASNEVQDDEALQREQVARELGRQQGKAEALTALQSELVRIPEAIAQTVTAFAREREAFYQKVEPEVVKLALSVARKVLHREAQVDPLLLAGMVRVALEGIEFSTRVSVRVHPSLLNRWQEYFAQHIDPGDLPELVEDPTLDEQRCVLQTHLGKTELGWEVQLKEIEQGLLDLLAQRPPAAL